MNLRFLVDTNIASYYLRRAAVDLEVRMADGLRQQSLAISAVTRAELRFGQAGMAPEDRRRSVIDRFLQLVPNLPWTSQAADLYGDLKNLHRRSGTPIGELDTLIAAHALAERLTLVTHNTRHFANVCGLSVEDWMS